MFYRHTYSCLFSGAKPLHAGDWLRLTLGEQVKQNNWSDHATLTFHTLMEESSFFSK